MYIHDIAGVLVLKTFTDGHCQISNMSAMSGVDDTTILHEMINMRRRSYPTIQHSAN